MKNGEIVGVEYGGSQHVYGDVIIDATGPSAPLAKAVGVSDLQRERQAIGIEYEFDNVTLSPNGFADLHDAMMLKLDHDIAPGGYSWIFHTGEETAKVGLCYIQNEQHQKYATEELTIDGYLQRWLETDPRLEDAEQLEGKQHRGSAHIQRPGTLSTDNFLAIGDTVPTIDPLWGEGIHKGMKSARAAATTVDTCLTPTTSDTSAEQMSLYDDLWHERVAPSARTRLLMTELLYLAPNQRYDRFMKDLRETDTKTLSKANDGNLRAIVKLLRPEDASYLAQLGKKWFRNSMPSPV